MRAGGSRGLSRVLNVESNDEEGMVGLFIAYLLSQFGSCC